MTHPLMTLERTAANCDIVGDVHGQADALFALLTSSGWVIGAHDPQGTDPISCHHPEGRFLLFTGDLVNKGPDSLRVLRLLMGVIDAGCGTSVIGNHDAALLRGLTEINPELPRGARKTLRAVRKQSPVFRHRVARMLQSLPAQVRIPMPEGHPMYGDGFVTVVHAACPASCLDKDSSKAVRRNIYGFDATGEQQRPRGRRSWTQRYDGKRWIIHGHTPARGLVCEGKTLCLDSGAGEHRNLALLRLDSGELRARPVPIRFCWKALASAA